MPIRGERAWCRTFAGGRKNDAKHIAAVIHAQHRNSKTRETKTAMAIDLPQLNPASPISRTARRRQAHLVASAAGGAGAGHARHDQMIEAAALAAEYFLPAGHPRTISVRHFAAADRQGGRPPTDWMAARHSPARDDKEPIGDGQNQRVIVNVAPLRGAEAGRDSASGRARQRGPSLLNHHATLHTTSRAPFRSRPPADFPTPR